jgi:hypothetical protein
MSEHKVENGELGADVLDGMLAAVAKVFSADGTINEPRK